MFDSLTSKLQNAFRNLRGLGKISESNVTDALREVRQALLEADVNFKVARDFIERVKTQSLGAEVVVSVAASARKSLSTRRVAPPIAFMRPTSFLRSIATLVMAAITQSVVSTRTTTTVALSRPRMRS